jgi:F-type H+-transporting ATPase subunit epsilon
MATATVTRELRCVVVTPEKALVDEKADFIALPLFDGEIGFLPGRAPMVGRLGAGELRIKQGNVTKRFYVEGGFVQVRANVVTVLTSKAMPIEALTPEMARVAMEKANTVKEPDARLQAQAKARTMQHLLRATV